MKKLSALCSLAAVAALGAELDESYLSDLKNRQFELEQRKADAQSSTLRDSWIQPVRLNYTYLKSDPYGADQTTKNATVTIDQPIFKSGGIYFAIKYAEAAHINATDSIEQQRRSLIKEAVSLLMQIRQAALRIERQELLIDNARINLEQKRELYVNGQIDSGFLDSAMVDANLAEQQLYDLQNARAKLLSAFRILSDLDPETARIPHLELLLETDFMQHNIDLKRMQSEQELNRYNASVTVAKYLPQLNLVAGYNREVSEGVTMGGVFDIPDTKEEYYHYGFKVSMPLDINSFSDSEAARMEYLKSQTLLDDKRRELQALYGQVVHNLENSDRKIALAQRNVELYGEILEETRDLYRAGYKTRYDVRNLENSVAIQRLDARIFKLDRQLELLALYEKMSAEGS